MLKAIESDNLLAVVYIVISKCPVSSTSSFRLVSLQCYGYGVNVPPDKTGQRLTRYACSLRSLRSIHEAIEKHAVLVAEAELKACTTSRQTIFGGGALFPEVIVV